MTGSEREELLAFKAAAETLLAGIKRQRQVLDRREREFTELVAEYDAKLGNPGRPFDFKLTHLKAENGLINTNNGALSSYGAITETVLAIFREHGRRMNVPAVAKELERREVPKTAKTYEAMVRTAIRRLHSKKKLRKVALGYYSIDKSLAEAHSS